LILLSAILVAGSGIVYFLRFDLEDPRRWLMALATVGFFYAPLSERELRTGPWLVGIAVVASFAQLAGSGQGGFALWLACSIAAALLVIRAGSRAAHYYLPEAGSDSGRTLQRKIRTELQIAVSLFLAAYVLDRWFGAVFVAASAMFFLRYVLLQSKHLGITATPLTFEAGIVPSQRWIVLSLCALIGGTRLPQAVLGEDRSALLLTASFLLVTAAMLFVLSLTRTGWSRSLIRRASFAAGILLAVAGTAVLVELESWDRARYRVFASLCVAFFVVLPFLKSQTKLFLRWPRGSTLVPPAALGVMMAPVSALGVTDPWSSTSVFLAAFSTFMLAYLLLVAIRCKASGGVYFASSLAIVLFLVASGAGDRVWQVFLLSLGFALYAIDRIERVWRETRARERIPTS
jgi:hypothetical protein